MGTSMLPDGASTVGIRRCLSPSMSGTHCAEVVASNRASSYGRMNSTDPGVMIGATNIPDEYQASNNRRPTIKLDKLESRKNLGLTRPPTDRFTDSTLAQAFHLASLSWNVSHKYVMSIGPSLGANRPCFCAIYEYVS